jgi:hypothetical protein
MFRGLFLGDGFQSSVQFRHCWILLVENENLKEKEVDLISVGESFQVLDGYQFVVGV